MIDYRIGTRVKYVRYIVEFKNQTGVIANKHGRYVDVLWDAGDNLCSRLPLDSLEYVTKPAIFIEFDGRKTTATLYDGGIVAKKAVSKCCPDDKYCMKVGAQIAFERLFCNDTEKQYYNGKVVCIRSKSSGAIAGKIYNVVNGEIHFEHGIKCTTKFITLDELNSYFDGLCAFIEYVE